MARSLDVADVPAIARGDGRLARPGRGRRASALLRRWQPQEGGGPRLRTGSPGGRRGRGDALRRHWPEYLMEAAGLGLFMVSAGLFGTLLFHPASPLAQALRTARCSAR